MLRNLARVSLRTLSMNHKGDQTTRILEQLLPFFFRLDHPIDTNPEFALERSIPGQVNQWNGTCGIPGQRDPISFFFWGCPFCFCHNPHWHCLSVFAKQDRTRVWYWP